MLRDTFEDVLLYSKDYFTEKAQQNRMASYKLPPSTSKPFGELSPQVQMQIEDVFKLAYDIDCDMSITINELRTLMGDLGGALRLLGGGRRGDPHGLTRCRWQRGDLMAGVESCVRRVVGRHGRIKENARCPCESEQHTFCGSGASGEGLRDP